MSQHKHLPPSFREPEPDMSRMVDVVEIPYQPKAVSESKTIQFNSVIVIALPILLLFLQEVTALKVWEFFVRDPQMADTVARWVAGLSALVGAANIALRLRTDRPVETNRGQ